MQRQTQFSAVKIAEPVQSFSCESYRIGDVIDKVGTQLDDGSTRKVVVKYTVTGGSDASAAAAAGGGAL